MAIHPENDYRAIRDKLHQFRQYGKRILIWEGLLNCLSVLLISVLGSLLSEAILWMQPPIRALLLIVVVCLGLYGLIIWIGKPFYSYYFQKEYPDDIELAIRIGAVFPRIKDRLGDALQVFKTRDDEAHRSSPVLAEAALKTIRKQLHDLDFRQVVPKDRMLQALRLFVVALAIFVVCFGLFPIVVSTAFHRLMHPTQVFYPPLPFQLQLFPGNIQLIQGEDVHIFVKFEGDIPDQLTLCISEQEQVVTHKDLSPPFEYDLLNLRKSLDYYIQTDAFKTPVYRIEVIQRPMVRMIQLKLYPPGYANLGIIIPEPNTGNIETLKGTRVGVDVEANKTIQSAELIFQSGSTKPMQIVEQRAKGFFIVRETDQYHVLLKDTADLVNEDPIHYTIFLKPDYPPVANIRFPDKHVDLDESMTIPLTLEAEDDFGISKSQLVYWRKTDASGTPVEQDSGTIPLMLPEKESTLVLVDTLWDLGILGLFPEDVVLYFYEVFDNDRISGPKRGRSSVHSVRFPSIYEIFQEVEKEQNNQADMLSEIYEKSRSLKNELEQISEELKTGKKLEWEDKKNLEQLTEQQQQMEQELQQLKEDLDQLINRMERNNLLSQRTFEKYQELQQLYEEIATPELLESMKDLQKALSQINEDDLKKAMENFQFTQEDFLKSIERTLSLLKRIQVEQKMDEMVRRIDDLIKRQEGLNQQLERADAQESEDLAKKEEGIKKDTETFQKEMQKLRQKMEELPGMPLSSMESILQTMENEDLPGQMERMQMMMQDGQFQNAGQCGSQTLRTMSSLSNMLKQTQNQIQSRHKQQVMKKLRETSYQLLHLSQGQEMLMESMQSGETNLTEASKKQMSLIEGLSQVADSLYQLAQQTFSVTPEMGKAMGKAHSHMVQTLQEITQSGNTQKVSSQQANAMGALNEAVMAIQESMNQLSGSGSGLGMEQFFLSLEQMGMQQMMINRQMMDLLQQGQLSLEQQASIARLAAEQAAVKRMLEETYQRFGDRSDVAGRLDQLAEEMEQVIEELKTNQASQETIRRQERILSRLLDAQRSVKQRDYSRKRQAKTGQDVFRQSPTDDPSSSEILDRIRHDILRLGKEGYTTDYQALIRSYFEAMIQLENEQVQR